MRIRTRGMLQCLGAGAVFAATLWWFASAGQADPGATIAGGPFGLIAICAPGGFALAGLLQWISGVPFSEMSDRWNALPGWQRGVYGTLVFVGGLGVLFGGLMLYGLLTAS
jgi:hypothetical protein